MLGKHLTTELHIKIMIGKVQVIPEAQFCYDFGGEGENCMLLRERILPHAYQAGDRESWAVVLCFVWLETGSCCVAHLEFPVVVLPLEYWD